MSTDDNVISTNQKEIKNPVDVAINKLREAKLKEIQSKIDAQTKVAFDARIISDREFSKLKELVEELEFEKGRISEFTALTK